MFWAIMKSIIVVGALALVFGAVLGVASIMFRVKKDSRLKKVQELLPNANCGGCGFPGCAAFAGAVVLGNAQPNGCPVSKDEVNEKIGEIMGIVVTKKEKTVAKVFCGGDCDTAPNRYEYFGPDSCYHANLLSGGPKMCKFGCLGLGSCIKKCAFGAITIEKGIARIDTEKCTACGACAKTCPRNIIKIVPQKITYMVDCSSKDRGAAVGQVCKVGCIACGLCEKSCPVGAVSVADNLAIIDPHKCIGCGLCEKKCPKKIIRKA